MDRKRKKELILEYKNRHPEMGVISYRCKSTGESFLGISKDTKTAFNSSDFQLSLGKHPNKYLQELWNQYGEGDFERLVLKVLKYEDPVADHTDELEELREKCLEADDKARKIWK
ncbi:MAG: GIY-YIG nuclease family protein [Muricomes sp.]